MKTVETFLRRAARIAKRRGLSHQTFTYQDLGDFFHVYGKHGSATKFVSMIDARNKARQARKEES